MACHDLPPAPVDITDPPTPDQFNDLNRGIGENPAHVKLMGAMLTDVVDCLTSREQNLRTEARRWVQGWLADISFSMVCTALQVEPERLRPVRWPFMTASLRLRCPSVTS